MIDKCEKLLDEGGGMGIAMSKYSVLLVDDEEIVYEVMMKKIDWEGIGFRIKGYARNGLEALEMAEEIQPDVVMTDIKMPYMDGLTLCRKLKDLYPNIRTIILSGFDDFEFAKEAIRLETEEYLLKPIDAGELREVFLRVKDSLDREISERRNIDRLQEYYMNSLPLLQDNFYASLLEGRIEAGLVSKYASDYQIHLAGPCYVVSVLHVSYVEKTGTEMAVAPFMLSLSVQQLADEQLSGRWQSKTLIYLGDIIVFSQLPDEAEVNYYTDFLDRICKMAKRVCHAKATAGIGYVVRNPVDIRTSYDEAKNALSHRIIYGSSRAINIRDIDLKRNSSSFHWEGRVADDIINAIKLGERDLLLTAVDTFCDGLSQEGMSVQNHELRLMKLSVELLEFIDQYELDINKVSPAFSLYPQSLFEKESMEELREAILKQCNLILEMVSEEKQLNRNSFVKKAEEYVRDNYQDKELGVEAICQHLYVSTSYFSTTFKKSTGRTFIQYLTDFRMEQAVDLLESTEYKTYEIAERVGYSDPNYFSYAFKKKYGVSPSRYRKQRNGDGHEKYQKEDR